MPLLLSYHSERSEESSITKGGQKGDPSACVRDGQGGGAPFGWDDKIGEKITIDIYWKDY